MNAQSEWSEDSVEQKLKIIMEILSTIKCDPELTITCQDNESVSRRSSTSQILVNGNESSGTAPSIKFHDEEDELNGNWQHPIDEESYEDSEEFISIDDDKAKSFLFNAMKSRSRSSEVSTDGDDESGMFLEPEIVLLSNDNEEIKFPGNNNSGKSTGSSDDEDVIVIDDDDDEIMFEDPEDIDENEDGVELSWMDLENQHDEQFDFGGSGSQKSSSNQSSEFECSLCNKKVASSYNLRRHMMIHTGELFL